MISRASFGAEGQHVKARVCSRYSKRTDPESYGPCCRSGVHSWVNQRGLFQPAPINEDLANTPQWAARPGSRVGPVWMRDIDLSIFNYTINIAYRWANLCHLKHLKPHKYHRSSNKRYIMDFNSVAFALDCNTVHVTRFCLQHNVALHGPQIMLQHVVKTI